MMLTATVPAASALQRNAVAEPARLLVAVQIESSPTWERSGYLSLLDPVNLRVVRRTRLPADPAYGRVALSPDRTRVALATGSGSGGRIWIVRLRDGWVEREAAWSSYDAGLVWPRPKAIYAVELAPGSSYSPRIVRIDPDRLRTVRTWPLPGFSVAFGATRQGAFAVRAATDGIRTHLVASHTSVSRTLPLVRGAEPWHVRKGAILPPLAREAVSRARTSMAAQVGADARDVRVVAVLERSLNYCHGSIDQWTDHYPGYVVYVEAAGQQWSYAYGFLYPQRDSLVPCRMVHGRREEPARARDADRGLLSAAIGTWRFTNLAVGAGTAGRRLVLLGNGTPTFEVDLESGRPWRLRRSLRLSAWHPYAETAVHSVDARRVLVSTGRVVALLDLRNGSHRVLARGSAIGVAGGRAVVRGPDGVTVEGYTLLGRRIYRLPHVIASGEGSEGAVLCGPRLYVLRDPTAEGRRPVRIYDAAGGRRLGRASLDAGTEMIPEASTAC